jgi:hypothetical protein
MTYINRETLIYPDVLASTKPGDAGAGRFAEAVTNNQDTVIRMYIYWYVPSDGGEPVLMIEMDDEDTGPEVMDIKIRVRRNDGLIYEGNQETQENREEIEA